MLNLWYDSTAKSPPKASEKNQELGFEVQKFGINFSKIIRNS
jgi:hypothetical protein